LKSLEPNDMAALGIANSWLPSHECLLYPLTKKGRRSTMTIALALSGKNSIVLATDSRMIAFGIDSEGNTSLSYKENVPKLLSLKTIQG